MKRPGKRARSSPPSEERARAWLAWLARGMQREGQTIFQLERLQPSWLASSWRRWVYYLASRLLQGAMRALTLGHMLVLLMLLASDPGDDRVSLAAGLLSAFLVAGLYLGSIGGIVDRLLSNRAAGSGESSAEGIAAGAPSRRRSKLLGPVLFGAGTMLSSYLVFRADCGIAAVLTGAIVGPLVGRWWAAEGLRRTTNNDILPIETVRISWASFKSIFHAPAYSQAHWMVGLFVAMLPLIPLSLAWKEHRLLAVPVILGVLLVVQAGVVQPGIQELKTRPNQGILLSARNGLLLGGLYGAFTGGLSIPLMRAPSWQAGMLAGLSGAAVVALKYGGLEVAKHYILRFHLWTSGAMPWRYSDFLDYAAEELHLLQKVGGGYIFLHRYLLEHFAAMPTSREAPSPALAAEGPA